VPNELDVGPPGHDPGIVRGVLAAKRAVQWLRVLADTWVNADVPEARADLLHAIYDRIVVVGRSIVAARLTPAAYSNGLALALPQVVMSRLKTMARPEGGERIRNALGRRARMVRGSGVVGRR
jgi:hypothetical protein